MHANLNDNYSSKAVKLLLTKVLLLNYYTNTQGLVYIKGEYCFLLKSVENLLQDQYILRLRGKFGCR